MAHFDSNPRPKLACRADAEVCDKTVPSDQKLANNPCQAPFSLPQKAELERMAKRRFQKGSKLEKQNGWWTMRVYQDRFENGQRKRARLRIRLAPATMGVREVQKVAQEHLWDINQGLDSLGSATNFRQFVNEHYIPVTLNSKAKGTRERYEGIITKYLEPAFGQMCLRDLTSLTCERFFVQVARQHPDFTDETLKKIRTTLGSIFKQAKKHGLLTTSPLLGLEMPKGRPVSNSKPWITPEQFNRLIALIAEPYATMVAVAVWGGLRVSEVIALRWDDLRCETIIDGTGEERKRYSIMINERCCRGDWAQPKTKTSKAPVGISAALYDRIEQLKALTVENRFGVGTYKVVKSCGPSDLIFQSIKDGQAAMHDNNVLCRHIKPAGEKLGMGWVNWRCFRTSRATWAIMAGANPKDVQRMMRHANIKTTLDIYAQFVPDSEFAAQERIEAMAAARIERQQRAVHVQ